MEIENKEESPVKTEETIPEQEPNRLEEGNGSYLSRLFNSSLRFYSSYEWRIVAFLVLIVFILLIIYLDKVFNIRAHLFTPASAENISKVTTPIKDIIYMLALLVAAIWTYFQFLKGRTFVPKLNVHIFLEGVGGEKEKTAIVRFKLSNTGRVKITELSGTAVYSLENIIDNEVKFVPFFKNEDIMSSYRNSYKGGILEPGDEIEIYDPIIIPNSNPKRNSILNVESIVYAGNRRQYTQNSAFYLKEKGDNNGLTTKA